MLSGKTARLLPWSKKCKTQNISVVLLFHVELDSQNTVLRCSQNCEVSPQAATECEGLIWDFIYLSLLGALKDKTKDKEKCRFIIYNISNISTLTLTDSRRLQKNKS